MDANTLNPINPPGTPWPNTSAVSPPAASEVDLRRKFVRVLSSPQGRWVCFEFAMGWPELAVELVLSPSDFEDFCRHHRVEFLPAMNTDMAPALAAGGFQGASDEH